MLTASSDQETAAHQAYARNVTLHNIHSTELECMYKGLNTENPLCGLGGGIKATDPQGC